MVEVELRKTAQTVRTWAKRKGAPTDLSCWCAICSYRIFQKLKQKNYKPKFTIVYSVYDNKEAHCVVLCKKYLIDCTATQFFANQNRANYILTKSLLPKIVNRNPEIWFWDLENSKQLTKERDIQKELETWPYDQNPFLKFNQDLLKWN